MTCPTEEEKARLENLIAEQKKERKEAAQRAEEEKKETIRQAEEEKKHIADQKKIDANTAKVQADEYNLRLDASKRRMEELTKQIQAEQRPAPSLPANWAEQHLQAYARGEDPVKLGMPRPASVPSTAAPPRSAQAEANERYLQALASGQDPGKAEQEWALKQLSTTTESTSMTPQVSTSANSPLLVPFDPKRLEPYQPERRVISDYQPTPVAPHIAAPSTFPAEKPAIPDSTSKPLVAAGGTSPTRAPAIAPESIPSAGRAALWPVMGVPSSTPPQQVNKDKVTYDWSTLNLARATYNDNLKPGELLFKNDPNWKVLDRREDKSTGFLAYTFVNEKEGRVVVGIQGSRNPIGILNPVHARDVYNDWVQQDLKAIRQGQTPDQFKDAETYVRDVKNQYGSRYSVDCTGHSLGGGACAYAAANVAGVHAAVIDPVSAGSIVSDNAYMIDNYVVTGDATSVGHALFERGLTGWSYKIEDPQTPTSGFSNTTPSIEVLGGTPIGRHSADRAIDAIARNSGLAPYSLLGN